MDSSGEEKRTMDGLLIPTRQVTKVWGLNSDLGTQPVVNHKGTCEEVPSVAGSEVQTKNVARKHQVASRTRTTRGPGNGVGGVWKGMDDTREVQRERVATYGSEYSFAPWAAGG